MPSQVSLKNLLLMLLAGLICAVGAAFLLNYLLTGPSLGPHYDFLLSKKKPVISGEILVINTEEYIEGSDFFLVLMTLTEMEASNLILTSRLSPSSSQITITDADIRRRFMEEYNLAGSNIRNLFEGIRMGTVSPLQAPLYVDRLVEMTEQGRDRLISALIERDEDLLRSVAVFGNFLESYTRPRLDKDGKLRRVKHADEDFEHPVFQYLKNRYAVSQVETSGDEKTLWLRANDGKEFDIHLDNEGNIITAGAFTFRRINISVIREYDEYYKAMLASLLLAQDAGMFSKTAPEKIPLFSGEYSNSLLEELLKTPNSENRSVWITSRDNFFKILEEYIDSSTDIIMLNELEEKIADTDPSNTRALSALIARRDQINQASQTLRGLYDNLSVIRAELKKELPMSLCIMGMEMNAEYAALLANTLITGSHIKPVNNTNVLFWAITVSFIILLIVFLLRPFFLLGAGIVLNFFSAAVFSGLFIVYSFWIDPLIILGSSLTGVLIIFYCKFAYLNYLAISFRSAYKAAVPKNTLQKLISRGRPGLSEINVAYAAVIAIKDPNLFGREDCEAHKEAGKIKRTFYAMAKKALFNAGAVVAGYEGDTIFGCFGSPLELKPTLTTYKWTESGEPVGTYHPAQKACALVQRLLKNEKITWRFGIDAGDCTFSWTQEAGFCVSGRTSVRARMLVSKASRYKVRALITNTVREKTDLNLNKTGTLYDQEDAVFELV